MDDSQLSVVADGRVFSGRQSLPLKLVDELGGERQAVAWLEKQRNVPANLPVKDWKPKAEGGFKLWSALGIGADLLGLDGLANRLRAVEDEAAGVAHGGLLAVWRPAP
jgi:protease-4